MENQYFVGEFNYDAKIYDGFNTHDYDLKFYLQWLKNNVSGKVLELCCGTGRLTIPLFENGVNISGADICKSMLYEAKKKALIKN